MYFRVSKLGTICCVVYLSLFLVALIFAKLTIKDSPLSAIYVGLLTFPWSYIDTIILFLLGIINTISTNIKLMMLVFYAIINASILYYLFDKYEQRRNNQKAKNEASINK